MMRINSFRAIGLLLLGLCALISLRCEEQKDEDVADIPLTLHVTRIDSLMWAFGTAIRQEPNISLWDAWERFVRPEREFFEQYLLLPDRIAAGRAQDSLMTLYLGQTLRDSTFFALLDTVRLTFPYDMPLADRISAPLKRLLSYFPGLTLPRFTAHVNGYFQESDWNQVDQLSSYPGILSFGLHYFMGEEWPMYPQGIFAYQRRRLQPAYFDVVLVEQIAEELVEPLSETKPVPLAHRAVRAGIKQVVMHRLLPYTDDSLLFRYTSSQMEWVRMFESANYKFMMPHLYSTDMQHERDFLADKAFTSELARESAPRLAEFTGWRLVESYLKKHPEVNLEALCEEVDYGKIIAGAGYKP